MADTNQLAEDLQFVRKAVEDRDKTPTPGATQFVIWAAYSLFCIPTYDFIPQYGRQINLAGWIVGMILSFLLGKRDAIKSGQFDHTEHIRAMIHFLGGSVLLMLATFGMVFMNRNLDETTAGQISVILVGFMYFYGGVHMPALRFMRIAGPCIIAAGVGLAALPSHRWTAVGIIFATCLLLPVIFGRRTTVQP